MRSRTSISARSRPAPGEAGGIATLAVKQVSDTREYGVVLHDRDGRITGFQEKPAPEEALSDLGNCGIYVFDPQIFDYFPPGPFVDWAQDVFPVLLENDVPFHIHEDPRVLERRRLARRAAPGHLRRAARRAAARSSRARSAPGGARRRRRRQLPADTEIEGPAWIGRDVRIGAGVRLMGPVVLGDGARVGRGAQLRASIVFPGTTLPRVDPDRGDRRPQRHPAEPAPAPLSATSPRPRRPRAWVSRLRILRDQHFVARPFTSAAHGRSIGTDLRRPTEGAYDADRHQGS